MIYRPLAIITRKNLPVSPIMIYLNRYAYDIFTQFLLTLFLPLGINITNSINVHNIYIMKANDMPLQISNQLRLEPTVGHVLCLKLN